MLTATVQRLESRFEQLVEAYKNLKTENTTLRAERDGLLQERQVMREELDRILLRFEQIDEESL